VVNPLLDASLTKCNGVVAPSQDALSRGVPVASCHQVQLFVLIEGVYKDPENTLFRITSVSKVFNAMAAMISRTLDQTVATLRKKIELDSGHPRFLQTIYRLGYRLVLQTETKFAPVLFLSLFPVRFGRWRLLLNE
jgi:DNA-binding response OmpR family regulator